MHSSPNQEKAAQVPIRAAAELSLAKNILYSALGGVAGATVVYPLDMAKTQLQMDAAGKYTGLFDCFAKVARSEGIGALYRGLPANIIGIMPEKTIKLAGNDFFRQQFKVDDKSVYPEGNMLREGASGGLAGACQIIVTTPMEITKIRMQMYEPAPGEQVNQMKVLSNMVKEMGIRGMYQGTVSTFMRDVPFSIVYFSLYGVFRRKLADENGKISAFGALGASTCAGIVGASGSTPLDVIKTRLQAKTAPGVAPYKGWVPTVSRIVAEEGAMALFKGVGPRTIIISPLFGIALMVKETLANWFP
uniref:Mitochondrial carrier protein n=1 Tax=Hemiselmis andersenii TaxID=464988 RepID=A0A6U4Z2N9_HEMAN|mmetsp:Transcript_19167/g.44192  ORF Transcript_19167/g.44192 Transcript_19167/m.44192 type:complete len:304 (+) Transcript_19167:67-978(+)